MSYDDVSVGVNYGEMWKGGPELRELVLAHLDKGVEGRPPMYVRSKQFIELVYVLLTISE